jgi:spermidine/putrescine transport system permease protein
MNRLRTLFLAPSIFFTVVLFLIPLGIVVAYGFLTRGVYGGVASPWTLENYTRLFDPLYGVILWRSLVMATISTILCLLLAFPLALFIARARPERKPFYLYLVILPFWTSFLVRTYAWMFLLRDTGLVNSLLVAAGVIREPLPLLYNETAVIVGLVYGFLPFAVLPLFSNLDRMDRTLLEAAADLGAKPMETLRQQEAAVECIQLVRLCRARHHSELREAYRFLCPVQRLRIERRDVGPRVFRQLGLGCGLPDALCRAADA